LAAKLNAIKAIGSGLQTDTPILNLAGHPDPMLLGFAEPPDIFNFIFLPL